MLKKLSEENIFLLLTNLTILILVAKHIHKKNKIFFI